MNKRTGTGLCQYGILLLLVFALSIPLFAGEKQPSVPETLSLETALKLTEVYNPQLRAYALKIKAQEGQALQEGLLPNPELEIEMENFGGGAEVGGFKATETTIQLGQLIELAGKRHKRRNVALSAKNKAAVEFEMQRLTIFSVVSQRFLQVLKLQSQLKLQNELLNLSKQFVQAMEHRVKAGKSSPAELARAQVALSNTLLETQKTEQALQIARQRLSSFWLSEKPKFRTVTGRLDTLFQLKPLTTILDALEESPFVQIWKANANQLQAVLNLERALQIPDPVVRVGWRRLNEINNQAFVAGVAIPFPIFDRNQGALKRAHFDLKAMENEKKWNRIALKTELAALYQELKLVENELLSLKNNVLPLA